MQTLLSKFLSVHISVSLLCQEYVKKMQTQQSYPLSTICNICPDNPENVLSFYTSAA